MTHSPQPIIPFPKGHQTQSQRDRTISDRIYLVKPIARSIHKHLFGPIQLEDLQGVGLLALVEACDEEGVKPSQFEIYVRMSIRNAVLDSVRRSLSRREVVFCDKPRSPRAATSRDAEARAAGAVDLRRGIEGLPGREKRVMDLRQCDYSQAETGRILGLSQRSVAKIEAHAIDSLRERLIPRRLKKAA